MTIRAKLYAAIVLSILGPLVTTAVALQGMSDLGDRFDEVRERGRHESIALQLKFGVTDVNGWQTAYGYDDGALAAGVRGLGGDVPARPARGGSNAERPPRAPAAARARSRVRRVHAPRPGRVRSAAGAATRRSCKRIFLGPELTQFRAMADTAQRLAQYEQQRATATEKAFDTTRDDARKRLIAVALGAAIVIVLLLVTAWDVARMALEGERHVRARSDD